MKARQRRRLVVQQDLYYIGASLVHLHNARAFLRSAGSHNAANYVQRALKSTQGAYNNASAQLAKQSRAAPLSND